MANFHLTCLHCEYVLLYTDKSASKSLHQPQQKLKGQVKVQVSEQSLQVISRLGTRL